MDDRVYWIWMQNAFGPGSAKPRQAVERAGGAKEFHDLGMRYWASCAFISDREVSTLGSYGIKQAEAALEYCEKLGYTVLTPDSEDYPKLLKEIYNPPAALYLQGKLPAENALTISIVGTRKATQEGLTAAREIAYQLALQGVAVISGGALGVDAEAHRGALYGRGHTVAVLPCGLDYPYLMDNAMLRREILDTEGALLTEFPMNTPVRQGAFQIRNRILSGMSQGVLVAEAPQRSGALITAKHALEQNREVFVFIGEDRKAFAGCAALAEDGARSVRTAGEITQTFAGRRRTENRELLQAALSDLRKQDARASGRKRSVKREPVYAVESEPVLFDSAPQAEPIPQETAQQSIEPAGLSESAKTLYAVLAPEPKHVSVLEAESGLSAGGVLAALTELEIFGLVKALPGQRFTKL